MDSKEDFEEYVNVMEALANEAVYYIFIPDVHGMLDELNVALGDCNNWIKHKKISRKKVKFIFGGDLIDRGPDSSGVVLKVKEYVEKYQDIYLFGNHDLMLMGTVTDSATMFSSGKTVSEADLWSANGGGQTCRSMFGMAPTHYKDGKAVPRESIAFPQADVLAYRDVIGDSEEYQFMKKHGLYEFQTKDLYFCHAPQSDVKNMTLNTRVWGHGSDYDNSQMDTIFKVPMDKKISVHGHYHRLNSVNFPRLNYYKHAGQTKIAIMADSGCGCSSFGRLHPIILKEYVSGQKGPEFIAIL